MSNIDKQELLVSKAKASVFTMGYISQFEASDIDSDDIDLRFEVDGVETGTTVSIVDECGHAAQIITALLDELEYYKSREERVTKLVMDNSTSWDALYKKLEAAEKRIAELTDQKATWVTWAENASGMVDMLRLRIAELERSETQLINERDSAESALNDAYKAVMGQAPEWSNWFSFENAIDEIELVCELWRNQTDDVIQFRQRIQELEAKLETTDRLQDGAFRDGLKAGFSYGQTDDQSGFTQCMSAYNTTPASLLPDGLIRAVHFYEQVKRENPPVETGAWKDAIDWVLKEACLAASTLESSREHEAISQQEKA
ncbi:ead/Ea22-like family protein [Salmonella enterica]|uniref:ead/Ea22-like family protein n=1 Tax=Salmonella enterica TaxID=28901 RepID=UPI0003BD4372|nr:ead/Ea22-like family protein [Salmonella enterica]ESG77026.1 EaD [Salmonella enterica subsp. enterica serovar Muenchen str. baa1594]